MSEGKRCPKCSQIIEDENSLICMYCGYALSDNKKIDNPNPSYFRDKDENTTNTISQTL